MGGASRAREVTRGLLSSSFAASGTTRDPDIEVEGESLAHVSDGTFRAPLLGAERSEP